MKTRSWPDENGHFGIFGGRYVAETIMAPLLRVSEFLPRRRPEK